MHLAKLVVALKAFNEPQMKRLKEYVHSPYFKVPAASVLLFDYLYTAFPDFAEKKIQPASIARKVESLALPSDQSWAGTHLLHSIEQFIGLEFYRQNKCATTLHQLHGSHEMQLFMHLHKDYSSVLQHLEQCHDQDTDTFYYRHMFAELQFNEADLRPGKNKPSDIKAAVVSLDAFYALKKLHYLLEAHVRKQVTKDVFPTEQMPGLLKALQPFNNLQYPSAYLFVNVYTMFRATAFRESVAAYSRLRDYALQKSETQHSKLETQNSTLPPSPPPALSNVIGYIIHHLLYWYNKGIEEAGNEYLWWVEQKMKYGWLLSEGKMSAVSYRNILVIAVKHKNPAWIKEFITECTPWLEEEEREANVAFGNGLLNYRLKNYKEAARCFLSAECKEQVSFNCLIRRWQWMSNYELNSSEFEGLQNQLLGFQKYLVRNKTELGPHVKLIFKFIHYSSKLLAAHKRPVRASLPRDLQKENFFPGKHWLIQQLNVQMEKQPLNKKPHPRNTAKTKS